MTPKIYVFCNSCTPEWHVGMAIAQDGTCLGSHICSSHGWIPHDMGVEPNGWKRDVYAKHYPGGFDVVYVEENPSTHPGIMEAYRKNQAMRQASEAKP